MGTSIAARPVSRRLWDPRVAVGLALVLVFLCGAVSGALFMDLKVHRRPPAVVLDTSQGKIFFERLNHELNLTPQQAEQIQSILGDFWEYYRTVLSDSKSRIEQVLTEEQRHKFEQLLQERQRPY